MRKPISFVCYSITAALCLSAVTAGAGFVSPSVPSSEEGAAAQLLPRLSPQPNGPPVLHWVTTENDDGPGSLRQAILNAAPGDGIEFALPLPATIMLESTLVIERDLAVAGPGPDQLTVMRSDAPGTPSFRVFEVKAGVVTLAGMTIRNGEAYSGTSGRSNNGGGILNLGTLTVSNCVISGNRAPTTFGGASLGFGAGIFSGPGSRLALLNSMISGNEASGAGGALCVQWAERVVSKGCVLSGNYAGIQGGGLNFQGGGPSYPTLAGVLENCTISGNSTAPDGISSGLLTICWPGEKAAVTLTACTVAGNYGSPYGACGLAVLGGQAVVTNRLLSTLVADNEGPNFAFFAFDGSPTLESLGHNLESDGTSGWVNGVNGDQVGTSASPIDAKLGPLQNNGGPTPTMALLPGSPALDAGACTDAEGAPLLVDQRGLPRPQGAGCDIGAYENQPLTLVCPAPMVVEFTDENGAVVNFSVTAIDPCPGVTTVVTPPSGSVFPIGVTTVVAQATDGCGNSAQCSFTVTVLGALGVKSNVLAELMALRAGATLDQPLATKFDQAIQHLQNSLDPAYWIDQTHLQFRAGNIAMNEEKLAVVGLQDIMGSKNCPVSPAVLQGFINRIVKCDRLLAVISIQDAAAAGLNPKKVAQDLAMVAKGDAEAAAGRYANAIEHYRNAWRHALQLQLRVSREPDGSTLVQFVGNQSKAFLIETSSDLVNWVALGTCRADTEGNVQFTDSGAVSQAQRFYRAVER